MMQYTDNYLASLVRKRFRISFSFLFKTLNKKRGGGGVTSDAILYVQIAYFCIFSFLYFCK